MDIQGKVFIVTGGASGLGEGTARHLAQLGAKVVVADMQEERGQQVATEIGGRFNGCAPIRASPRERAAERCSEAALSSLREESSDALPAICWLPLTMPCSSRWGGALKRISVDRSVMTSGPAAFRAYPGSDAESAVTSVLRSLRSSSRRSASRKRGSGTLRR